MRIASVGHAVFAATLIALGILGLIHIGFSPIWVPIPKQVSGLAYLCAVVSLASGVGLLLARTAAVAARVLLAYLLLWLLLLSVPGMVLNPNVEFWWAACKIAVMTAAAWVLYTWLAIDWDRQRLGFLAGNKGLHIARALYGVALIPLGMAHFLYLKNTASLVPRWLPWHEFWVYFTGWALIAAGVAVLIGVFARLAAALSAFEIGMFTVLVWGPVMAAGSKDPFSWSETGVSVALTAGAWVVAESYRDMSWLAVNKR